jgi:AraC family transcriptional regulator, arabinose operon regulatory protein
MDQRVQMVITLMENNLSRDVSFEEIAQNMNLSASRLRHLFKSETGKATAQYFKVLRMKRAKELIETTFLSMKQIMRHVGVKDKSHFARDFKKIYGLTPAQYRYKSAKI